jgi:hypothetical protein
MCLLLVASPGSTPKKKDLECASCNNPHGFGFAVITPDGIVTGRGMSAKKVIQRFLEVRRQFPDSYAMFHARYATHGVKNEENCHPFKVGGRDDTYLAHNGILDLKIPNGDKRSDTRLFAEDILPMIGGVKALDDDNINDMVSRWSRGSKIVIFTLDPAAKYDCYIINEDAGHWDNDGIWWSNSSYLPYTPQSWTSKYFSTPAPKQDVLEENDSEYDCTKCGATNVEDANPYYCEICYSCYDCGGMYAEDCMCYQPNKASMWAEYPKEW